MFMNADINVINTYALWIVKIDPRSTQYPPSLTTPYPITVTSMVTEPNREQNPQRNYCSHSIPYTMGVSNILQQILPIEILSQGLCEH